MSKDNDGIAEVSRFWLFRGDQYYPGGGHDDFCCSFTSLDQAVKCGETEGADWWHVLDAKTMTVVRTGIKVETDDEDG